MFTKSNYIEKARRSSEFIRVAASSNLPESLSLPVPSCPDWDMSQLVGHQGSVYRYVDAQVSPRAVEPVSRRDLSQPPEDKAKILEWYEESEKNILETLEGVDPSEAIWSWTTQQDGSFWIRRMAHETLVHAWDAGETAGNALEISNDWGADGADEYLSLLMPVYAKRREGEEPQDMPSGSLHLHRTDADGIDADGQTESQSRLGEWFCEVEDGQFKVLHKHDKADAAIRASGRDLFLLVWGRIGIDSPGIELFGDEKIAAEWVSSFAG